MSATKGPWPSAEAAVAAIIRRESFANARLHYASRIAGMLALLAALTFGCVLALLHKPQEFRYIMTSPDGTLLPMTPTAEPNHDPEYIAKWTMDSVTRLYSFDYVNFRQQLQDARRNLTAFGWDEFQKSMERSGNFRAILANGYAVTAAPTGPAKVLKSAIHPLGRYAWRVEFPMLLTYQSGKIGADGKPLTANQNLKMTVVVLRQPEYLQPDGLGIRSVVGE